MPIEGIILNLAHYEILKIEGFSPVKVYARYTGEICCPHCGSSKLRNKDKFIRELGHESIGLRRTILYLESHKYRCLECMRYFNQRFPGIQPRKRNSESFIRQVVFMHNNGHSLKSLSKNAKVSYSTIERWNRATWQKKVSSSLKYDCPKVLGIDEHFFTKKQGFATTFCDLAKHRIYDVALGKSSFDLRHTLNDMPGKDKVRLVVMDLSETYRSLARRWFPKAQIVCDRFHVIRLINEHFMKYWSEVDEKNRGNRGLLRLMRKHRKNLKEEQRIKLEQYLNKNPGLQAVYNFKQKLCRLLCLKGLTKKRCVPLVKIFTHYLELLKNSPLYRLGKTLKSWSKEIVLMWRFSRNNGITEGFHTKMEMISRRAYGFRNFENYRLRVRALCA